MKLLELSPDHSAIWIAKKTVAVNQLQVTNFGTWSQTNNNQQIHYKSIIQKNNKVLAIYSRRDQQFQYQMYRRPQSAKPQIQLRSATHEKFSFRKKLEREILDSNMLKNKRSQLASNFLNRHDQVSRMMPHMVNSSPERLFEQNLILKREINDLQEEMRLLKAKLEVEKRNYNKYANQLDAEFGKEMFWSTIGSGNHVVMGVKRQYQKLKQKLEQAEQQLVDIKRTVRFTEVQQLTIERDQYKLQSERLAQKLSQIIEYGQPMHSEEDDKDDYAIVKKRSSTMQNTATSEDYEVQIQRLDEQCEQYKRKIEFLENRLVEKENNQFTMNAANRRLTQQVEKIKQKNKELTQSFDIERENLKTRLIEGRENERKRYEKELLVFNAEMESKKAQISKLQKQIGYLSTLLSYWKPLQEHAQLMIQKKDPIIEQILPRERAISFRKDLEIQVNGLSQSTQKANSMEKSMKIGRAESIKEQTSEIKTPVRTISNNFEADNRKTVQNYAMKRYKVKKEQILLIGEEIRYRLIDAKIQMNQAVKHFNTEEGIISIENIIQILKQEPFNVKVEDNAILLARYLVEDQNDQVVYYDPNITNQCTMVKAIFQQAVPKYKILSQQQNQRIKDSVLTMLRQYNNLLTQTISSQCGAKCILSKSKFVEILNQQQLNHGQLSVDFMVSLMLKYSTDLSTLEFKRLAEHLSL